MSTTNLVKTALILLISLNFLVFPNSNIANDDKRLKIISNAAHVNNSKANYGLYLNGNRLQSSFHEYIPDYYQEDTSFGGFTDGGKMYCGPVAVSNSLLNLLSISFFEDSSKVKMYQHTLISTLASEKYMRTGAAGSSPFDICRGLQKFLNDNDFRNFKICYYGWRSVPYRFRKDYRPRTTMEIDSLKNMSYLIWLNFGWYNFNEKYNSYFRTSGHWVTFVSFCDSQCTRIRIQDPATRQENCDTITVLRLSDGCITGNLCGLPIDAEGYYRFTNKYGIIGIIDGFVVLEIKKPVNFASK